MFHVEHPPRCEAGAGDIAIADRREDKLGRLSPKQIQETREVLGIQFGGEIIHQEQWLIPGRNSKSVYLGQPEGTRQHFLLPP